MIDIKLIETALSDTRCLEIVEDDSSGGTVLFKGTVRNHTAGKEVVRLEFEAYAPMAIKEMRKIAEHIVLNWPVIHVAIHHRIGNLDIGEVPVLIAVSAAHRNAAFEACMYAIDTLKEEVPIWKKEYFKDGAVWVAAHP